MSDAVWTEGMRLGLLVNPDSRRNSASLNTFDEFSARYPQVCMRFTASSDEISATLAEFAANSIDVLAISGGDGTVSSVLTALLNEKPFQKIPLIAILPGGTANMTAGDIGSRGSIQATLRRLGEWLENNSKRAKNVRRSVVKVQSDPSQAAHYGFFFGAGAIVQGIEYTNENIHSRGMKSELSLGLGLVRTIWGIARQDPTFIRPTKIAVDIGFAGPAADPQEMTLLIVSTLERLFLNMRPYWGESSGHPLHMTLVRSPVKRLIRNLPALLRGKPNRHMTPESGYLSYNLDNVRLTFDGPFTLDGEIIHASSKSGGVDISASEALSFLQV